MTPVKFLVGLFLCFSAYGFLTGHIGGALMSLFMVVFTIYGDRQLHKRDREHFTRKDPIEELEAEERDELAARATESGRDTF